jgi:tetratricopeptide (TPR) repeat protein
LIDIYSWQKRQDLARRTAQQSQIDDSLASKSLATESLVTESLTTESLVAESLAKESPELILAEQPTVTTDSQSFKKGSMVVMSSTLSTTLTPHQLSNTVSTVTISPSRGQLVAALATLLLLGGVGYYFSLPPTPPSTITNNNGANFAISPTAETNEAVSDVDLTGQVLTTSQPPDPELIKEIETLVKHQAGDQAQKLLTPALKQAEASKDPVAQSKLLYLQGRIFSQRAEFARAIVTLKQAITLATPLNKPELFLAPEITLANIYHVTDQNAKAALEARVCLKFALETNNITYQIASLQTAAISEFLAYRSTSAEASLQKSILLAEQQKDFYNASYGYIYLGVIKTEQRQFAQADRWFDQALTIIGNVDSLQRQFYLEFVVNGYYARSKALAGKIIQATNLYHLAINRARQAGVKQYLTLSQLHHGLAQCLSAQGQIKESERETAKAELLEEEALHNCESSNTALSFALNRKVTKLCE